MKETIDTYRPEVGFGDIVDGMRVEMQDVGLMQALPRQRFEIAIAREIDLSREVAENQLTRNWKRIFPGVEFSEDLMREKLNAALERWKEDAYRRFDELAKRDANVRVMRNVFTGKSYFFRRWDVRLIGASVLSVFTFPFWASQIFAPSDWQLQLGLWGLILNLGLIGLLAVKANRKKGSANQ